MQNILILYAHPNPQDSTLNKALVNAASSLDGLTVHDLYQHYPDFDIDIQVEQDLLEQADIIVFQHPVYWYSCPAIMKEWIDVVLQNGFAYGENGNKLNGKKWLSAITTGGDDQSYGQEGKHYYPIDDFLKPFERTAAFCSMEFLPAFISHDAIHLDKQQVESHVKKYLERLKQLRSNQTDPGETTHA